MKWLWITALLFLVTGVKSGPPTRKVGDIVAEWNIDKIERTAKSSATASEQFKFTFSKIPVNDITMVLLEVIESGTKIEDIYATDKTPAITPTFEASLTDYSGKNLTFLTDAKNETFDTLAFATVDITPFPYFPVVTDTALLKDPRIAEHEDDRLFRAEGTWGDMHLKTDPLAAQGDITYYSFSENAAVGNYVPCYEDGIVLVDVCDTELKHDDAICETKVPIVDSAVLAHGPKDSATIKLTFQNNAVTHEAILIPQPSQSSQSPDENVLCTDFTGSTCNIKWSDPSSAVLQLIIIQKTTDQGADPDTWATSTFDIHDRELAVTQLGADIIEGRWLMLEGEYPGDEAIKSIYRLRKTVIGTNSLDYEDIEVDCSHLALDPRLCFGYFPQLDSDKTYTLTVAYKGTGSADEMNQIESSPVKITASKPELEILSRHMATHQNQQRADVQICFQHLTPTEGRSFSHYEMLIINEKWQWLKHSIMEEEEEEEASEERLCFAPFSINTNDFDLTEGTKAIISQRGADGITVLASGESLLF